MEIKLIRFSDNQVDSTLGLLYIDGIFECFTLEDIFRDVKVKGKTRIPSGTFKVVERNEISPSTLIYRKKHDWFEWHIMLEDVPGYKYIYIHPGNYHNHTDGCILVGRCARHSIDSNRSVEDSVSAYKAAYKKIIRAIRKETVEIKIIDSHLLP